MYKILNEENVIDFARQNCDVFKSSTNLTSKELSDGNINYVFRVVDEDTKTSVIIKQATKFFRTSPEQPLTDKRIVIEVNSMKKMQEVCPGFSPKIYKYIDEMKCCIMEDCNDYHIMRSGMLKFETNKNFGKQMGKFLSNLHFYTSSFYLDTQEKAQLVNSYLNPEMCEITQRLVFTEPFTDYLKRNPIPDELIGFVKREIYDCKKVKAKAAKLKNQFLTSTQSLIHGDLHTGSIFINENDFKVFDSEFAFVGPCSYDIGCIVGNILFAYVAADIVGNNKKFKCWTLKTIQTILNTYKKETLKLLAKHSKDPLLTSNKYCKKHVNKILRDGIETAGVEILRRTITSFKVADITKLSTETQNIKAQQKCIVIGKQLLLNSDIYIDDFFNISSV